MIKIIIMSFLMIALLIISKYILFNFSYVPRKSKFHADIDKIRALSDSGSELPLEVNCLFTGEGELLDWTIVAGYKPVSNHYIQTSFQFIYAGKSILLDTSMDEKQFEKFKYGKKFFKNNYNILQSAMRKADLLILTHEHWDHSGGVAKSPYLSELIDKIILTKEQVRSSLIKKADFPLNVLNKIKPLDYKKYYQVSPGIVLIKAPGHTQGHQMIYVKLQNENEFLFIGDIVWNFINIEKQKARPLIVNMIGGENPVQIGNQIRWLCELYNDKNNKIHIIPSHDITVLNDYIEKGLLGKTFKQVF